MAQVKARDTMRTFAILCLMNFQFITECYFDIYIFRIYHTFKHAKGVYPHIRRALSNGLLVLIFFVFV
uniref:Uncharacterized protein n=1 Tax=Lepeophtheirus salmonis TaxID=72036 RepID=A0A0K2UXX4_LEPSM